MTAEILINDERGNLLAVVQNLASDVFGYR